jgi:hypothetical protein
VKWFVLLHQIAAVVIWMNIQPSIVEIGSWIIETQKRELTFGAN